MEANMKLSYVFLGILILFGLSACNSATAIPTKILPVQPTATQPALTPTAINIHLPTTSSPILTSTPKEWLPYDLNLSSSGCGMGMFTSTLPVKEAENLSQLDIAHKLFEIYLAHYRSPELGGQCRLEDFKVEDVKGDSRIDFLAKEQKVDFVSRVLYSVQIKETPSDWVAGNGELATEGW